MIKRIKKFLTGLLYYYYKLFKPTFTFQNKTFEYFCHKYNRTWRNERTVEIPIVMDIVKSIKGNILEVGNVLSHYFPVNHDVIDKFEKGNGVINEDVVEFHPNKKYDLIISISTLEHVGRKTTTYPEEENPDKILYAIDNLKKC